MARIPIISFFTGGGFLDIGFEMAGFRPIWTNESNPEFADCYEYAIENWRRSIKTRPIRATITSRKSIEILKATSVLTECFGNTSRPYFGIIGGPPCPDFSRGGTHSGHKGTNGRLTTTFVDLILRIKPDFFVIENVSGLMMYSKHRRFMQQQINRLSAKNRYLVDYCILNALHFGVPQFRERLFVIGFRKSVAEASLRRRMQWGESDWFPWPTPTKYAEAMSLDWPKISKFGSTPKRPPDIPRELTVNSVLATRPAPTSLPNGREHFNSYSDKFYSRDEGDVSSKSFKRLHRHRYSPTAWYGNQEVHLHPWKPRRLSVREALRIQSVPDQYILPEDKSLSCKFKLICNGVPCELARHLGHALKNFIADAGI